jgi:Cu2+-containing amine oxidase
LNYYIQNVATGDMYALIPGAEDQVADTYARGDLWVLAGRSPLEFDDGNNSTITNTEIGIDRFVNGESIRNADLVVWYAAHYVHITSSASGQPEPSDHGTEFVGPDLVPIIW